MDPCEKYEPWISAFLDGELSGEDRAELMEHMAACPSCQRYFDDLVARRKRPYRRALRNSSWPG